MLLAGEYGSSERRNTVIMMIERGRKASKRKNMASAKVTNSRMKKGADDKPGILSPKD